ncbi:hypothetical protein ACFSX6_12480, partial [Hymenobacter rubripertinctus]|uniref:hypothetical protein n=1 Tax=Hymenobacter rubripertinctus TaxID=2029981 RepID=UPI0036302835
MNANTFSHFFIFSPALIMKNFLPFTWRLTSAMLVILTLSITSLLAQTFQNYAPSVCPNQTMTYTLTGIPADYKIEGAFATGGSLFTPAISNGQAEYVVTWGAGESGRITPGLKKPKRDANGNIVGYDPATPSNTPSVVIKSVFGRRILAQINNTA